MLSLKLGANGLFWSGWETARLWSGANPVTALLAVTTFLVMVAYLPGVLTVSTAGRWALITLVGLPAFLISLERFDWSRFEVRWLSGLFSWMALSLLWTNSGWDTAGYALQLAALVGLGILAAKAENTTVVWYALAIGVTASLPIALLEASGHNLNFTLLGAAFPDTVGGLFLSSSTLSEVGCVACILMALQRSWGLAGACGLAAALSGRKEAYLMLLVAGSTYLWFQREALPWPSLRAWLLGGFALVVLAGVNITIASFYGVLYGSFPTHEFFVLPFTARAEIWTTTVQSLNFLGWGAGTYGGVDSTFAGYGSAHNEYLQWLFELGFGAVFIFGLGGYAFAASGNINERVALAALAASAFVWGPFQDPASAAVAAMLVGALCSVRARARVNARVRRTDNLQGAEWAGFVPSAALRAVGSGDGLLAVRPQPALGTGNVPTASQRDSRR